MGVLSGLGNGLLGHHRQGRRAADLQSARRQGPRAAAQLHLSVSGPGEGDEFYHDPVRSAERAAEYVAQGFTGLKFDPTGGYSAFDPRQPTQEALERTVRSCAWCARPSDPRRIC
jgi:L-alanine-DL-glutamate epimerase-like enolase superfamily enzyme